jgi:site-specific recombinase XerD
MLEFSPGPRISERAQRCWLWPTIDGFLQHLEGKRYRQSTLRWYASGLLAFGEYTARQGVSSLDQLPQLVGPFADSPHLELPSRKDRQQLVTRFIRHLQQNKLIPAPSSPPPTPHEAVVEDYLGFLRDQRGLARGSVAVHRGLCAALLAYLAENGIGDLHRLRAETIHRFIIWRGQQHRRHSLQSSCSALRCFLSHLYRRKIIPVDLAAAVVSPRVFQQEQCPRFLTSAEIESLLVVIDRRTPLGRRDYAMVLLLAVYGLRGIEVVSLSLDDIDWHHQLLHIRKRKAGNNTTYPLSVPVGEAVIDYLRQGRPTSTHREVFLTMKAPFGPMVYSTGLAYRVRHYLTLAGISVARPGTHSFRYSCAQRLFQQGMPLKTVGDYLGHCNPTTTQRYTKVALEQLREVANGDGEDVL